MLHDKEISKIAERVARGQVLGDNLERVLTEQITDSEGKDALRITVVLKPEAAENLSGDSALDLLVELQNELQKEGDERFATVQYATEEELEADAAEQDSRFEDDNGSDDEG